MKKGKKFRKIIIGLGILGVSFGIGCKISAYAEPLEEEEPQTTEVVEQEEQVTISMKLNEFLNKWLTPIVSGALGLAGSLLGYLLYKKRYKVIMAVMSSGIKLTEEQRKQANSDLTMAKELYETAKADFEQKRKDYEKIIELAKDEIKELKAAKVETEDFKRLVAYLIASTPELAKNGYAEKILKLLDEGKKIYEIMNEDVGDTDGTNN